MAHLRPILLSFDNRSLNRSCPQRLLTLFPGVVAIDDLVGVSLAAIVAPLWTLIEAGDTLPAMFHGQPSLAIIAGHQDLPPGVTAPEVSASRGLLLVVFIIGP